jgi:hypothetical protein
MTTHLISEMRCLLDGINLRCAGLFLSMVSLYHPYDYHPDLWRVSRCVTVANYPHHLFFVKRYGFVFLNGL